MFTSQDVARLTDVTLRQLQWWDEQGVVTPIHRSHRRLYNRFEVLQVSLIIGLRAKGMSLQKTRGVLKRLKESNFADYVAKHAKKADVYLLTDGDRVFLENTLYGIVKVLGDSDRPMIALCISELVRKLDGATNGRKPIGSEVGNSTGRRNRVEKVS